MEKEIIERLKCMKKYVEYLGTPDEFFKHMQGHRTELSLVLSAFDVAKNADAIIHALEKRTPKNFEQREIKLEGALFWYVHCKCPACNYEWDVTNKAGKWCPECGQALRNYN